MAEVRVWLLCLDLSELPGFKTILMPLTTIKKKRITPAMTKRFLTMREIKAAGDSKAWLTEEPPSFSKKLS